MKVSNTTRQICRTSNNTSMWPQAKQQLQRVTKQRQVLQHTFSTSAPVRRYRAFVVPKAQQAALTVPVCKRKIQQCCWNKIDPPSEPFSNNTARNKWSQYSGVGRRKSGNGKRWGLAAWGADVPLSPAKITKSKSITENLFLLYIDVGEIANDYSKPGQYVQIKVGTEQPGYFAMASPPDPNNVGLMEFLVKRQPGNADALCDLKEGAEVQVSAVMGKGFPMEKIPAKDASTILMFATGTGVAPIKALIESDSLETPTRKDVRLYYGTRTEESTAFRDLIPEWEASGVRVTSVYSYLKQGYIQDVFAKDMHIVNPESTGIVLCGQKDMCNAIKALVKEKGVSEDKIVLNF